MSMSQGSEFLMEAANGFGKAQIVLAAQYPAKRALLFRRALSWSEPLNF
jgi:hypothetical protein